MRHRGPDAMENLRVSREDSELDEIRSELAIPRGPVAVELTSNVGHYDPENNEEPTVGTCRFLFYDRANSTPLLRGNVSIWDPFNMSYLLAGDRIYAKYNPVVKRYEPAGAFGLLRHGLTTEVIAVGGSGDVSVSSDLNQVGTTVKAWLPYMHGDLPISAGIEVAIHFIHTADRAGKTWIGQWIIIGAECETS